MAGKMVSKGTCHKFLSSPSNLKTKFSIQIVKTIRTVNSLIKKSKTYIKTGSTGLKDCQK